jgi:hypothetical protein
MKTMTKKDWIILRVIRVAVKDNLYETNNNADTAKAIMYLIRRYGSKQVMDGLAQLREEGGSYEFR